MRRSALWILGGLLLAGTAQAQVGQVQAIRPTGAENLNRHLSRLASNPRDVDALIGAGEAALDMDDVRAAAGFFARADTIQPNNARVKAGLGRVMLKNQNPAEALRLFDQATRLGYGEATLLSDRGLARDMTGDQAGAQRDYQDALRRAPNDAELTYRYAASLGIAGQVDAADRVLQPLLHKGDRAAWRYRAFILAMNNRQDDARKIANQTMPAQLAAAITPYMQKMPYLTPAQKAAAVHFGHFPTTVGTRMATATPTPGFEAMPTQPPASAAPPASSASQLNAITLAQASAPAQPAAPDSAPPAPRQQPNPEATRTLAEIIHAIDVPDTERQQTVAAVDLAEIEKLQAARRAERQATDKAKKAADVKAKAEAAAKAKAKAEADAKAKKAAEEKARLAANPSRNWVQIGTGSDRGALAFTLKGLRRKYDDIAPQDGWVATWGRTNRLLIGPFASFTRARTVESKLKAAGADVFAWQSDAGEVVERIGGK